MSKKNTKSCNNQEKFSVGLGITTAVVTAVGTYFLYGSKNADKNRKKVKSWMLKAKAEVLEGIESARELSRYDYENLVNTAIIAYTDAQNVTNKDIKDFKDEMKSHWAVIEEYAKKNTPNTKSDSLKAKKSTKASGSKVKDTAKKTAKTTKKTVKKVKSDIKKTIKKKTK